MIAANISRTPYVDPVRTGKRVRIRVNVTSNATSIPGVRGRVAHGEHEIVVHPEDMSKILDLVEDEKASLPICEKTVKRAVNEFVASKLPDEMFEEFGGVFSRDFMEWPEMEKWPQEAQKVGDKFLCGPDGTTVAKEFRRMHGRGRKPLSGVEILDENVAPELSLEAQRTVDAVAVMNKPNGQSSELQAAMETIRSLQSRLDALEGAQKSTSKRS